jgi:hypothetical protein
MYKFMNAEKFLKVRSIWDGAFDLLYLHGKKLLNEGCKVSCCTNSWPEDQLDDLGPFGVVRRKEFP